MTDTQQPDLMQNVPEEVVEQVKQALENLYDFPFLQRHTLASKFKTDAYSDETAGQRLRREIIDAIETLNPGEGVFFRAPHARLYNLLHLHYVEGMTVHEAANDLGISIRQAYRDLRRGEVSIAEFLWLKLAEIAPAATSNPANLSSVLSEVSRIKSDLGQANTATLLRAATRAVERLAAQQDITIQVEIPGVLPDISTNPAIAQQLMVNLLSQAVQQAQPGTVNAVLNAKDGGVWLSLYYAPRPEAVPAALITPVIGNLAAHLGWAIEQRDDDSQRSILLQLASGDPRLLVIDDNEGLVDLLKRYLTDMSYRLVAAQTGQEGLHLAQNIVPDVIVLDVMMPEMDGWEVLQRLRTYPQTASIPVIICSVFSDPELAYSLGASYVLTKPFSRDDFLDALRNVLLV